MGLHVCACLFFFMSLAYVHESQVDSKRTRSTAVPSCSKSTSVQHTVDYHASCALSLKLEMFFMEVLLVTLTSGIKCLKSPSCLNSEKEVSWGL